MRMMLRQIHDKCKKPIIQEKVCVSVTKLEDEKSMQLSLFDGQKWQRRKLAGVMDDIRTRYGSIAITGSFNHRGRNSHKTN
ncbi:hypothetical protein V6B14_22415 (plasmid) [Sporosarcina psychrophila]